ncbi:PDZ domain-containing protein, partial [Acidobacteria bacterium ACD]|nr:PDZ domain-containing protein [Acidobacteria bacterium ACD]
VRSGDDLLSALEEQRPGERVEVTVQRDGRTLTVPVTLQGSE